MGILNNKPFEERVAETVEEKLQHHLREQEEAIVGRVCEKADEKAIQICVKSDEVVTAMGQKADEQTELLKGQFVESVTAIAQKTEEQASQLCQKTEEQTGRLCEKADEKTIQLCVKVDEKADYVAAKVDERLVAVSAQLDAKLAQLEAKLAQTESLSAQLNERVTTTNYVSEHYIQVAASLYNAMVQKMSETNKLLQSNETGVEFGAGAAKELVANKWRLIDKYYHEPEKMECNICGHQFATADAEQIVAEDIFGGGRLVRFRCAKCGAIIGPNKMWELTEPELSEEYKYHYKLFEEGQTSEAEMQTFFALKPEKDKIYLDYGCGAWSYTIEALRAQGYNVYGFDPYAPVDSEYIISDFDEIRKMKFDGIFSHDLLEHLRYPVETFDLFAEILKPDGKMAHATACYKYVYEYTRFHLVFYTGNSVEELCKRTKFKLTERIEDNDILFFNYIYEFA